MKNAATLQCRTREYTGWRSNSFSRTTVRPCAPNRARAPSSNRSTAVLIAAPLVPAAAAAVLSAPG